MSDTTTTAKQGRRRARNLLPLSEPPLEDAEMRAAWEAYCRRVGRDPSYPPESTDELRAAFPGQEIIGLEHAD